MRLFSSKLVHLALLVRKSGEVIGPMDINQCQTRFSNRATIAVLALCVRHSLCQKGHIETYLDCPRSLYRHVDTLRLYRFVAVE